MSVTSRRAWIESMIRLGVDVKVKCRECGRIVSLGLYYDGSLMTTELHKTQESWSCAGSATEALPQELLTARCED